MGRDQQKSGTALLITQGNDAPHFTYLERDLGLAFPAFARPA